MEELIATGIVADEVEALDMFPVEEIQLPPYLEGDTDDCAQILIKDPTTGQKHWQAKALDNLLAAGEETPDGGKHWWKKWVQSYLACTAFADHQIGSGAAGCRHRRRLARRVGSPRCSGASDGLRGGGGAATARHAAGRLSGPSSGVIASPGPGRAGDRVTSLRGYAAT